MIFCWKNQHMICPQIFPWVGRPLASKNGKFLKMEFSRKLMMMVMIMVISRSLHPFIQNSKGLPTSISKRVFLPFNIFHRQIIASDRVKVVCQVHFWRPLEFIRSTKLPNSKNIWDKIDKYTNRFCQIGHFDVRSSAQCQFLFPSWHFAYWWVVNFAILSWVVSFAILYSVINFCKGPIHKDNGRSQNRIDLFIWLN